MVFCHTKQLDTYTLLSRYTFKLFKHCGSVNFFCIFQGVIFFIIELDSIDTVFSFHGLVQIYDFSKKFNILALAYNWICEKCMNEIVRFTRRRSCKIAELIYIN